MKWRVKWKASYFKIIQEKDGDAGNLFSINNIAFTKKNKINLLHSLA
jgi:hypothetical protein